VACCQVAPAFGDLAANRELTARAIESAANAGASIVVLPELVSSGYVFESQAEARACAEAADGETVTLWARLAARHQMVIVGGFCEKAGGVGGAQAVFNSAALIDPGGLRAVYRKAHLWDRERLWFTPGNAAPPVVGTPFGRIAVMICYDLEFPEWVRLPALDGAQLLCAPVNWPAVPRPAGERAAEVTRVQADAGVNRMFVAACDRDGAERGVSWVAGSVIADPDGYPLAGPCEPARPASPDQPPEPVTVITAACRLGDALDKRVSSLSDVHGDRRPELYRGVTQ
jgi:predicted amidohydrolase